MIRWIIMFQSIVIKSKDFSGMNITQRNEQNVDGSVDDSARTSDTLESRELIHSN